MTGRSITRRRPVALAALLLLAACGAEPEAPPADPAPTGALEDRIVVDPDQVGQGSASDTPSIATARAQALQLVGGPGAMRKAPEARQIDGELPAGALLTAAARTAATPGTGANCAEQAEYSMDWAARLPVAFPVYPGGTVQEAAGSNASGCALRVVSFTTPVPLAEVMDFYFTRASATGYSAQRVLREGDDVLAGTRGGASYVVYARRLPSGGTEVDLVASGGA